MRFFFLIALLLFLACTPSSHEKITEFLQAPSWWNKKECAVFQENFALKALYTVGFYVEDFHETRHQLPRDLREACREDLSLLNYPCVKFSYETGGQESYDLRWNGPDQVAHTADDVPFERDRLADNFKPMYGGKQAVKTAAMENADREFLSEWDKRGASRRDGSNLTLEYGKEWVAKGEFKKAMKRFNQAWLLDPTNMAVCCAFRDLLEKEKKYEQMQPVFEECRRGNENLDCANLPRPEPKAGIPDFRPAP